jgi:hypothetical protein
MSRGSALDGVTTLIDEMSRKWLVRSMRRDSHVTIYEDSRKIETRCSRFRLNLASKSLTRLEKKNLENLQFSLLRAANSGAGHAARRDYRHCEIVADRPLRALTAQIMTTSSWYRS